MISTEPNEIARPRPADDVEPLWHIRLPSGMVTMTLDELDAAYQQGAISEQTLVVREDETYLRPLGVVAGIFEPEHRDAPRSKEPRSRTSDISGVQPAYARHHFQEPARADASTWTLLDGHRHAAPGFAPEAMVSWESAPERWLRQARAALRRLPERATNWFVTRSPRQRWALCAISVASLAAVCALWPAQPRPPSPELGADLALQPRSPRAHSAPVASPEGSLPPPATTPSATVSIPSRGVEQDAELDMPIVREASRQGSAFAERRKAGRSEGSRRSSRKARASRHRASRE